MENFAYLIGDENTGLAAVVDPAWDIEKILKVARKNNLRIVYAINTHHHPDHTSGNDELVNATGAKIVAHEASRKRKDIGAKDGETLHLGSLELKLILTPGHSPDHMCILVNGKLMTGDALFVGECGRTDLPGGNSEQLYDSLFNKLMKLADDVEVYPGHNYGPKTHSTIGYEKTHNYILKPRTAKEFVQFMREP